MPTATIAVAQKGNTFVLGWDEDLTDIVGEDCYVVGHEVADVFGEDPPNIPGIYSVEFTIELEKEAWESYLETEPVYRNIRFIPINVAPSHDSPFPILKSKVRL